MTHKRPCANCKHCVKPPLFVPYIPVDWPLCSHPARKTDDPVHGALNNWRPCGEARQDVKDCGPEGRMFEPSLRHRLVTALFRRDPE